MQAIGKILKSNGTDGGLLVSFTVDPEDFVGAAGPVYIVFDGLEVPFFILDCEQKGKRHIIHLNDVRNLRDAEEMAGRGILADIVEEPDDTPDFIGWKVFDCSSAATFNHSAAPLEIGIVTGDEPIPRNYCIYVDTSGLTRPGRTDASDAGETDGNSSGEAAGKGGGTTPYSQPGKGRGMTPYSRLGKGHEMQPREVLIPLHPDFIVSSDSEAKELLLNLPEGLY